MLKERPKLLKRRLGTNPIKLRGLKVMDYGIKISLLKALYLSSQKGM